MQYNNSKISKNFVITGASGSTGYGIAKHLVEKLDCNVLMCGRSKVKVNFKSKYKYIHGIDLLNPEHLEKLKSEAASYFSESFHIVNLTGTYNGQKPLVETPISELAEITDSIYKTVLYTAHTMLPLQIKRGGGHFIGISCNSTIYNYPFMVPFVGAKAAVNGLILSIAEEYGGNGINSNAFLCSTIYTKKEKRLKPNGDFKNWLKPWEIAEAIIWLVSNGTKINPKIKDIIHPRDHTIRHNQYGIYGNLIELHHKSETFRNQTYIERIGFDKSIPFE